MVSKRITRPLGASRAQTPSASATSSATGSSTRSTSRVLRTRQGDQGHQPRAEGLAEGGAEGDPLGRDRVRLRAEGAAAAEAGAVAGGAGTAFGSERGAVEPGTADADAAVRGAARSRLFRRLRCGAALRCPMAAPTECGDGGLRATELRARRGLPVRLEPRDRRDQGGDDDREGRAPAALPQPDAVRAGVSTREPGDGVRRPRPGLRLLQGDLHPRDLR
jgi:hypothetical protein